jgi:epoxide hydrolase-like predicted phosphatase
MVKAIIFDFGGVIIPNPWEGWNPSKEERTIIHNAISEIAKQFSVELNNSEFDTSDFEREFAIRTGKLGKKQTERIVKSICSTNKDLLPLISKLSLKYKIFGLVNAPFGWTEVRLGVHGLNKYFGRVFASHEIGIGKPDPKIFHYFLNATGLTPNECLFVDDVEENVSTAIKLGMQGYVFKSTENFKKYLATSRIRI